MKNDLQTAGFLYQSGRRHQNDNNPIPKKGSDYFCIRQGNERSSFLSGEAGENSFFYLFSIYLHRKHR